MQKYIYERAKISSSATNIAMKPSRPSIFEIFKQFQLLNKLEFVVQDTENLELGTDLFKVFK